MRDRWSHFLTVRRIVMVSLATAGLLALGLGAALASSQKPGAYSGNPSFQGFQVDSVTVNFKVVGDKVKKLRLTPFIPSKCGFGGAEPKETSKPARIKNGRFSDRVNELTTDGAVFGTAKVTGTFDSSRSASGKFNSSIPGRPECAAKYTFTAGLVRHSAR